MKQPNPRSEKTAQSHVHDVTTSTATLNKLRAAVLGANDGIVSISSVLMGVAGATNERGAIFTAGTAALVAGALSMAVGEYVSVSSQSDAEKSYIQKEKHELATDPEEELQELAQHYVDKGVNKDTALQVAKELTKKDALKAHLVAEFNLDEADISSPIHAAVSSLLAFAVGGIIPFLAITLSPEKVRLWATSFSVFIALMITGYMSAKVGNAPKARAMMRVVVGGLLAMLITFVVGKLFGSAVA
jgi:VIT1/CCC1 family predicted Fe2+/Mn2+ transporter